MLYINVLNFGRVTSAINYFRHVYVFSLQPSETAKGENYFHKGPTRHPGILVPENQISRHLYERGSGTEDQLARIPSPGNLIPDCSY